MEVEIALPTAHRHGMGLDPANKISQFTLVLGVEKIIKINILYNVCQCHLSPIVTMGGLPNKEGRI